MRDYRRAYDVADVDGDNALEREELEMVITAMNPRHGLSREDLRYLWDVMVSASSSVDTAAANDGQTEGSINFLQYLHGIAAVAKDERAAGWLNVEQPNKWELLSLLVDTPVSEVEEAKILESLSALERMGIRMLKNDRVDMDKENMRAVLKRAGEGRLRHLNAEQISRMHSLKRTAWLLSAFIGFIMTVIPCAMENLLVMNLEVDGVKDRFDVCLPFSAIQWGEAAAADNVNASVGVGEEATSFPRMVYPTEAIVKNWELLQCQIRPWNSTEVGRQADAAAATSEWYDSVQIQPSVEYYDWRVYYDSGAVGESGVCLPGATWADSDDKLAKCQVCECEVCQCMHHVNGVPGGVTDPTANPIIRFWVVLGIAIGLNVVGEIALLMRTAVKYCTKVAWALDQRLVPLNSDRAFVADSLVRAAFELGNPDSPVLGVDPQAEERSKLKILMLVLLYKAKVRKNDLFEPF